MRTGKFLGQVNNPSFCVTRHCYFGLHKFCYYIRSLQKQLSCFIWIFHFYQLYIFNCISSVA